LWLLIHRTRIGALIRAGVDDAEMVEASSISIRPIFPTYLLAGVGARGLAGLMWGPAYLSLYPSADAGDSRISLALPSSSSRPRQSHRRRSGSVLVGLIQTLSPGDVFGTCLTSDIRPDGDAACVRPLGLFDEQLI